MLSALDIDEASASGQVTLVVFTPDATMSHLVGSVEGWLRAQTGCAPIARAWVTHTPETLDRFYPSVLASFPQPAQLILRAFTWGPCLATLWFGENAAQLIPRIKGGTEPASCSAHTLRGRFWCDNGVANLVHVSDDAAELTRELAVLRSITPALFTGHLSTRALAPFADAQPPTPRHSGILTLCNAITTLLSSQASAPPPLDLPDDGSARETMARAEGWLARVRPGTPPAVAEFIDTYLDGSADPFGSIHALADAVPIGDWEELILRCSLLSRPRWRATTMP